VKHWSFKHLILVQIRIVLGLLLGNYFINSTMENRLKTNPSTDNENACVYEGHGRLLQQLLCH
jgi:uncharacterized protein YneF (UPF0154 family)